MAKGTRAASSQVTNGQVTNPEQSQTPPPPVTPAAGRLRIQTVAVAVTAPMIQVVGHPLIGNIQGSLSSTTDRVGMGLRRKRAARALMDGIIAEGKQCNRLFHVFEYLIDAYADAFERETGISLSEP